MKLIPVDGNRQKLDGGAMFGNASKTLWQHWCHPDEHNRIELATRALLLQTDEGKNILLETGIGAFFEPKLRERYGVFEEEHMLLKNLPVPHTAIDAVILSHLHFDHAGGLLTPYTAGKEPDLLFPNARYYVGKAHWERANAPHLRERASFIPRILQLLKESGRLQLVDKQVHADFPFLTFHFSDGHTIGLMLAEIQDGNDSLTFISDLCPGLPWMHLPITMGYDRYPEQLINEKEALFKQLHDKKGKLFFTHDLRTPFAEIRIDEKGRYYGHPLA